VNAGNRLFFVFFPLVAACATLGRSSSNIELADIEKLKIGVTTGQELMTELGQPDQVLPQSANHEEVWIYFNNAETPSSQRASFVVDSQTKTVLSAVWIPNSQDLLLSQGEVLKHFESRTSLRAHKSDLIANHEFPREIAFKDPQTGVSVWVNSATQEVQMIGFGTPSADRVISNN
jgi:hypothetical protein